LVAIVECYCDELVIPGAGVGHALAYRETVATAHVTKRQ
jgi:hypothetical protein